MHDDATGRAREPQRHVLDTCVHDLEGQRVAALVGPDTQRSVVGQAQLGVAPVRLQLHIDQSQRRLPDVSQGSRRSWVERQNPDLGVTRTCSGVIHDRHTKSTRGPQDDLDGLFEYQITRFEGRRLRGLSFARMSPESELAERLPRDTAAELAVGIGGEPHDVLVQASLMRLDVLAQEVDDGEPRPASVGVDDVTAHVYELPVVARSCFICALRSLRSLLKRVRT
ncbi:MAG: hypothetical protein R3F05_04645 [Planctomycetota bacterium]